MSAFKLAIQAAREAYGAERQRNAPTYSLAVDKKPRECGLSYTDVIARAFKVPENCKFEIFKEERVTHQFFKILEKEASKRTEAALLSREELQKLIQELAQSS